MIEEASPLVQTLLGTGLTWAITALGATGCIFVHPKQSRDTSDKIISWSLSFSAGVMVAASFWSLLVPSLELSEEIMFPYFSRKLHFIPSVLGFILGALFVYFVELYMPNDTSSLLPKLKVDSDEESPQSTRSHELNTTIDGPSVYEAHLRKSKSKSKINPQKMDQKSINARNRKFHQKRLLMLIFAVTLHNFPEGAAVGIAFSDPNKTSKQFNSGRSLAIGIAVQNFPEGLVVSLPLRAAGFSVGQSVWYGQLSGMVEPLAGLLALFACQIFNYLQPIGLAFAAGTMIYVVFQDVIPEAHDINQKAQTPTTLFAILGFCIMMLLEVGLI